MRPICSPVPAGEGCRSLTNRKPSVKGRRRGYSRSCLPYFSIHFVRTRWPAWEAGLPLGSVPRGIAASTAMGVPRRTPPLVVATRLAARSACWSSDAIETGPMHGFMPTGPWQDDWRMGVDHASSYA